MTFTTLRGFRLYFTPKSAKDYFTDMGKASISRVKYRNISDFLYSQHKYVLTFLCHHIEHHFLSHFLCVVCHMIVIYLTQKEFVVKTLHITINYTFYEAVCNVERQILTFRHEDVHVFTHIYM